MHIYVYKHTHTYVVAFTSVYIILKATQISRKLNIKAKTDVYDVIYSVLMDSSMDLPCKNITKLSRLEDIPILPDSMQFQIWQIHLD